VEELPCELVREWHFLGSGVQVKQLRSQRKAGRARSVPGNSTRSWISAPNVRKNATLKESSRAKSHVHRARFNGRPKLPGWLGKRWRSPKPGCAVAFIEGEGKEVSACTVVSGRGGAVLEHGNLFKGGAAILADSQNGDIIVLSHPMYVNFQSPIAITVLPTANQISVVS
jgi:hypothetical protein